MIPVIATLFVVLGSVALIRLDRSRAGVSKAVILPTIWLAIAFSRPVSNWISFQAPVSASDQYVEGSPLDRAVLSLILAMTLPVLARRWNKVVAILRLNPALLVFLGYCLVSMLWAEYPLVLLKRWIRAVGDVVMVCIILTEANPGEALKRVMMWVGATLIPISILFTRFFPSLGRSYAPHSGAPMWTGVATDKNALGALCMLVGVFLIGRGLWNYARESDARARKRRYYATGTILVMCIYLLGMIDSKTALACFVMASSLVALAASRLFFRPWLMTTQIAAMVVLVYSVLFLGLGSSAISSMGRDTTLTGRTDVWQVILPMAVNPWIGAGFENFWIGDRLKSIAHALDSGINQSHNGYIEIYLNIGWVGLISLGWVIVAGYRNILRGMRQEMELSGFKFASFFICLVYNFTEASFKIMSPVWIIFLWATLATPRVAGTVSGREAENRTAAPARRARTWWGDEAYPHGTPVSH